MVGVFLTAPQWAWLTEGQRLEVVLLESLFQGVWAAQWRACQQAGLVIRAGIPTLHTLEPFRACPSLLKCCFCALYICEFLETPPTLLSMLANEPTLFYLYLLALSTQSLAVGVDFLACWCYPVPPSGHVEPLPN